MESWRHGRALYLGSVTLVTLGCVFLLWEMREVILIFSTILSAVLTPFLISVIIAYLLNPLVNMLHRKGLPRGLSIMVIYALFFLLMTALLINAIPLIIDQLRELGEHLPQLVEDANGWLKGFHEDKKRLFPDAVVKAIDQNLSGLEARATATITEILEGIGNAMEIAAGVFVIPFLVFYMLKDLKVMERTVIVFFPKQNRQEVVRLLRSVDEALGNYIRGQLLVSFVVGVLAYIGYLIVDMPYALLLALLVSVFNIVPYIGPFIGAAPAVLLALIESPMLAVKVLVVNLIIQQLEGNLLSPLLIGRTLKLHPMLIIFALLLGGELFGVVGLILAIPVTAVGKVILQHLVLHYIKR